MTTAFPGAIDAFTNPTASDPLDSVTVPHASQHANINDAVEAIETAIGTTAAPVLAPLASPTFTGTPAAPTATVGTNTTQIATTAFVLANGFPVLGFTTGNYYSPLRTSSGNSAAVLQTTYYLPMAFFTTNTFNRISIQTATSYVGTGAVRLGIYNNDSTTGKPSTVLLDAGTVATTASNTNYEITISQSLTVGYYWLAFNMQTAAATPNFVFSTGAQGGLYTISTVGVSSTAGFWTQTGVSGAFATAGTLVGSNSAASVALRAS